MAFGEAFLIYFFRRDTDFIRCDLRPGLHSSTCEIEIQEPGFSPRIEAYQDWEAATARWFESKQHLRQDGWQGPFGRE